jgi:site-specific DNA recombinase
MDTMNKRSGGKGEATKSESKSIDISEAHVPSISLSNGIFGRSGDIVRVLAYRRVSTLEQGRVGNSLDSQAEEIDHFCRVSRLPEPIDFVEMESGGAESQEKRDEMKRLLKTARKGDLVLVTKIDRFSRDIVFTISAVRGLIKNGARFLSLAERFDASTPEGEMQMAMWASIAQMERARITERTQGNRKRLRALGKFVYGRPPFGYVQARGRDSSDKPRRLEIDPEKACIVREIFDLCVNGDGIHNISRILQAKYPNIAALSVAGVLSLLGNRIYTGQLATTTVRPDGCRSRGQQLPAEWIDTHEPIVSFEVWSTAQRALDARRNYGPDCRVNSKCKDWLLRGLMRCAICDTMITAQTLGRREKRHVIGYYVCRKRTLAGRDGIKCVNAPYVRPHEADDYVGRAIAKHLRAMHSALLRPPPRVDSSPNFGEQRNQIKTARARVVQLVSKWQSWTGS